MMKMQETRQLNDDSVVISYRKKEFIQNFSSTTSYVIPTFSRIILNSRQQITFMLLLLKVTRMKIKNDIILLHYHIKRNVLYIRHIHETFSYYSRKYSNDNEALFSLFDFGDTCLFPFGDTRYQSNHLIDSNTCINNIVLISVATKLY